MKTKEALQKEWDKLGFSCNLWVDPPGQIWKGYVHEVDERVYVVEGKLEFEIVGKKYVLNPNDELLIPARTKHSVKNIGSNTARWFYGYKI